MKDIFLYFKLKVVWNEE